MADLERMERALRNADAAGDAEAARTIAQAIMAARAKAGGEVAAPNAPTNAERIGMGLADPIQGGAQLLTRLLPEGIVKAGNTANNWLADKTGLVARLPEGGVDQQTRERESAYQSRRGPDAGIDWLRLAGNVASPVNLALGAGAAQATTLPMRMGAGAATGTAAASMAPVDGEDFWEQKAQQAALGGVMGGAVPGAVAGVSRVVSPRASVNPQLDLLRNEGVRPTIGQTLGGWANRTEEKLQSVPIMGDAITAARNRATTQLNSAAINRATAPIGVTVKETGQEGIKKAGEALSSHYDDVLQRLGNVSFDPTWQQQVGQLRAVERALTPDQRGAFAGTLKNLFDGRIGRLQGVTASKMKNIDSDLGEQIRRLSRSPVSAEQERGKALGIVQSMLREQVARQSPATAKEMAKLNTGWANLVRVEGAGKAAMNNEGLFTPAQLNQAIRTADNSARKRAVSRGTALMQDLGTAGQQTLGGRVPNSGTVDRLLLGGGALGSYAINPAIPAALLGGAAAYSPPAQALLRGLVSSRPGVAQPVAGLLNRTSPMLAPAGGLLGVEVLN